MLAGLIIPSINFSDIHIHLVEESRHCESKVNTRIQHNVPDQATQRVIYNPFENWSTALPHSILRKAVT